MTHSNTLHQQHKRTTSLCQAYLSPAANDVVEAYDQTTLKWDPTCLTTYDSLDIYLQSVDVAQPIHLWKSVTTSDGQLTTTFIPSWWNSTNAATLQLVITGSDQPAWAGSGAGPTFFAEFNGTVPSTASAADKATTQTGGPSVEVINVARSKGLPTGSLAAAVLFPLLAVAGLIAGYIIISRRRSGAASKRWSQYVDERMSTAVNGGGGLGWEAGRLPTDPALARPVSARVESMYRHSASLPPRGSFAANRTSSAASIDQRSPPPAMSQPRQSTASFTQHRQSAVSFVDSPLRSRTQKSSLSVNTTIDAPSNTPLETLISPDQENGPPLIGRVALNRNSVASNHSSNASSKPGHSHNASNARSTSNLRFEVDDTTEKLTNNPTKSPSQMPWNKPFWKSTSEETEPPPALGMRRLSQVRTSTLSPDEALRQYTLARERAGPPSLDDSSSTSSNGGMRVLYTPSAPLPVAAARQNGALASVYTTGSRYSSMSDANEHPSTTN